MSDYRARLRIFGLPDTCDPHVWVVVKTQASDHQKRGGAHRGGGIWCAGWAPRHSFDGFHTRSGAPAAGRYHNDVAPCECHDDNSEFEITIVRAEVCATTCVRRA